MDCKSCEELKKEFLTAMEEWVSKSKQTSRWVSTEALTSNRELKPLPLAELVSDYQAEEDAIEQFINAHNAYWECIESDEKNPTSQGRPMKTGPKVEIYDAEKAFERGEIEPGKFGATVKEYNAEELARGGKVPPKFGPSIGEYNPE